jgi:hypothetical protein
MSKHHPMQSCKDFMTKPKYRNRGTLGQCWVCGNTFVIRIGSIGNAFWVKTQLIKGEK